MKRAELAFSAILVPVDYLMIVAAGLAAYRLRFWEIASLRPVVYELPIREYIPIVLIVGLVWLLVFAISGLYAIGGTRRFFDEFIKIILACSTGVLLIILLIFFRREMFSSRFIILVGWVAAMILASIGRLVVRSIQRSMMRRGVGLRTVCVVGHGETAVALVEKFNNDPGLGYRVGMQLAQVNEQTLNELCDRLDAQPLDEVILADPFVGRIERMKVLDLCNDHHVAFKYAADLLDTKVSNIRFETQAGQQLIEIKRTPLDGWGRILKRIGDTILAVILLIILSPVFLITAVIIRLETKGPIFYQARRVGESNRPFTLYKFRSMVNNAHAMKSELMKYNERNDGPLFKIKDDPRITRVGKFIRKTSIDELPQLFNVILGNMSLVGPRPHEPEEVIRYRREHRKLLAIKPGMTGLAQISGRSELNFDEEAKLDIYYIEHWSPLLDLKVVIRTPWVVLNAKSVS
ncbi:MAG: sugar transferase [Patescibacteria group bacterium]|jgi:exopolysaccharide biosynthesis polyprenyl glycosylphosphotransferase